MSENSFQRIRGLLNFPIKLDDKGSYLVAGFEYRGVDFDYEDETSFSTDNINRFSSFNVTLGYTFKMKRDWRFAVRSGILIASNFEERKIIKEDVLFSGSVFFLKDRTKQVGATAWRLIFGLRYATTAGIPIPLPFLNYYKKFHPQWSYAIGIPKTNLVYTINKKNVLQAFATLDGFYGNIQGNQLIPETQEVANSISMTIAWGGVGYQYNFTKHLIFYTYVGHTFVNDIRLRDEDQQDVLTVNEVNTFNFRTGIRFKI
ncbi:DUF6268 family outer membrane beta-barrel protein [Aquimarina sp. ERC-38]|uniref:DUF6268 family outer membrane beta-barrel protein n=1 Tax=Aquimarina sp. ERC-38 TaxID=2949996 RepID=UPI002246ABAA|nr:DUF6268 family outer membrane beta-barrel protein [Aquimarina sp. ERC-38]UZO81094.1 DUF6268 family outer membrane beta-barrel protein [Aquimarina sp. ERC-38]